MRTVIRRMMFRDAFLAISGRYGGEDRKQRRAMAWARAKRAWKSYREKEQSA